MKTTSLLLRFRVLALLDLPVSNPPRSPRQFGIDFRRPYRRREHFRALAPRYGEFRPMVAYPAKVGGTSSGVAGVALSSGPVRVRPRTRSRRRSGPSRTAALGSRRHYRPRCFRWLSTPRQIGSFGRFSPGQTGQRVTQNRVSPGSHQAAEQSRSGRGGSVRRCSPGQGGAASYRAAGAEAVPR